MIPKPYNTFWTFFYKEVVPEFTYSLAVCKNCGQKMKMQQSSTSSAWYHLKTKHPLDFVKLTKLAVEQEKKRAKDLKKIQKATAH